LNGGTYLEYGERFKIGERLTAQGQPAADTPNDATKSFTEEDGALVLRFTILSNDLVAQYTGTRNTVSANVVRRFTITGERLYVESRIETLDLMALLAGRGVSYQVTNENSVRQACTSVAASQAAQPTPQVERPSQNNMVADFRSPPFLRCGDTVDCSEKSAVLASMSQALAYMQSSRDPVVQAFSEVCRDVRRNVMELNSIIRLDAGIMQPQLDGCNAGLREMHRQN
jgi:hypothetical protein